MVSFKELSTEEKYIVRLKVATRKYDVINNYIKIVINEKVNKDIILEEEDKYDYCSGKFSVWESIHKNVEDCLDNSPNGNFIEALAQYKLEGGILGAKIRNDIFFKFYKTEEPLEVEKAEVGRSWIDYNEQLLKGNFIYDKQNLFGIWATNWKYFYKAMDATERYGHSIMVLSPIDILEYAISEKEIVGDGFNVRMHGSLHDEQTWYEMWRILGDKVFDELPSHIRQEYDGAKEAYEKYLESKKNIYVGIQEDFGIKQKATIIDRIKSILHISK